MLRALAIAAALSATLGASAWAQTSQDLRNAVIPVARPAETPVHGADSGAPALPRGVAQTSIERRFAHDRASGAVGFLCGRDPDHGGETPFGDDPHGRFLGAKLAFAIR